MACDSESVYLFTQKSTVLEVNFLSGALSSNTITTDCLPGIGSDVTSNSDKGEVYLACYAGKQFTPSIITISESKVSSQMTYNAPCSIGPISYDSKSGKS